jgi:SAM-dependent methyltransferase
MTDDVDAVTQAASQQKTRTGRTRPPRRFDQTQLRERQHGATVHRDYCAHFFRWVTVKEATNQTDRILDIGCGQDLPLVRVLTYQLAHVPAKYVGVDLNPIPNKSGIRWVTTLDEFNFVDRWGELADETFTKICAFEILEHMHPDDGLKFLEGAKALLAQDGVFYLSTPVFNGSAAVNHCHEYGIVELAELIEGAGLKIKKRYGTFGNTVQLRKVLTPEEKVLWERWQHRLGNDGLSVVFATDHPDESRNNLWLLTR